MIVCGTYADIVLRDFHNYPNGLRNSSGAFGELAERCDVLLKLLGLERSCRHRADGMPCIAKLRGPVNRRPALAAYSDRRMGFLHRFR